MTWRRASAATAVFVALYGLVLISVVDRAASGAPDFPNYYYSVRQVADNQSLYAPFDDALRADFGDEAADNAQYFADPPTVALLVWPLTLVPYEVGWWVLAAASSIGMVAAIWLTATELGLGSRWSMVLSSAALLTTGFRYLLLVNHIEVILAVLAVLGWRRWRRVGDPGLYWGVAAGLKLFPALWTVALVRNRRAVMLGLAGFLAVIVPAAGYVGFADFGTYVRDVVPLASQWYTAEGNYSLMALGSSVLGEGLGWFLTIAGVAGFIWSVRIIGDHPDALYVSSVGWSLLLSPLSWLNYLVIAVSPLLVAGVAIDWQRRRQMYPGAIMVAGLVLFGPVRVINLPVTIVLSSIPTLSLVLLAAWAPLVMVRARQNGRALGASSGDSH